MGKEKAKNKVLSQMEIDHITQMSDFEGKTSDLIRLAWLNFADELDAGVIDNPDIYTLLDYADFVMGIILTIKNLDMDEFTTMRLIRTARLHQFLKDVDIGEFSIQIQKAAEELRKEYNCDLKCDQCSRKRKSFVEMRTNANISLKE